MAAIYYGLGVTEHSQGTHHGDGDRQPGDGDRQYRPARRRREPAARPEQRAGLAATWARSRTNCPAIATSATPARGRSSSTLWGVTLDPEPGLRIPNMLDAAVDGTFKGLYIQGEDIVQSDPDTQHVTAGLAAMECVVVQDLFLNETANYAHVFLPGSTLPGEGRHLHQRRAPHQPRAQGDGAARRHGGLGGHAGASPSAMGLDDALHPSRPRSWTRSPPPRRPSPACRTRSSTSWARCSGRATTPRRRARRSCTSTASCAARASSSSPNTSRPTNASGRASRCC